MSEPALILDAPAIQLTLVRIAHQIAERNEDSHNVVLLGIPVGGDHLAARLAQTLATLWNHPVPVGILDVTMHRDDLDHRIAPTIHPTDVPFNITGKTVVLVDDVLFSGRTTRAALDALNDLGRPRRVQLAVLVDRGHRELPVRADFVGKNVPTHIDEKISLRLTEAGAPRDEVWLLPQPVPGNLTP